MYGNQKSIAKMLKQELENVSCSLPSLRTYEIMAGGEDMHNTPLLFSIWLFTSENIPRTRKGLKMKCRKFEIKGLRIKKLEVKM